VRSYFFQKFKKIHTGCTRLTHDKELPFVESSGYWYTVEYEVASSVVYLVIVHRCMEKVYQAFVHLQHPKIQINFLTI